MAGTFVFSDNKSGESKCHFLHLCYKKPIDQEKDHVSVESNKKVGIFGGFFIPNFQNVSNNLCGSHIRTFNLPKISLYQITMYCNTFTMGKPERRKIKFK